MTANRPYRSSRLALIVVVIVAICVGRLPLAAAETMQFVPLDRNSTRPNSSH